MPDQRKPPSESDPRKPAPTSDPITPTAVELSPEEQLLMETYWPDLDTLPAAPMRGNKQDQLRR